MIAASVAMHFQSVINGWKVSIMLEEARTPYNVDRLENQSLPLSAIIFGAVLNEAGSWEFSSTAASP
jgi:hypothetical protein